MSSRFVEYGLKPEGFSLDLLESVVSWYFHCFSLWSTKNSIQLNGLEKVVRVDESAGHKFILFPSNGELYEYFVKRQIRLGGTDDDRIRRFLYRRGSQTFKACLVEAEGDFRECAKQRGYLLVNVNGELCVKKMNDDILDEMKKKGFVGLMDLDKVIEGKLPYCD